MTRKSPDTVSSAPFIVSAFQEEEELLPGLALRFARLEKDYVAYLTILELSALSDIISVPHAPDQIGSLLSPAELLYFESLTYPKRRREWLGGRLACKAAVLLVTEPAEPVALNALSIRASASGAPELCSPALAEKPLPAISISHSGGYAVAMAAPAESCGIDIQNITPQTLRVQERFASPAEIALLGDSAPDLQDMEQLTLLWTAKEALKKALLRNQPPVFQGVVLQSVRRNEAYTLHLRYPGDKGRPAAITGHVLPGYCLAYTIRESHA